MGSGRSCWLCCIAGSCGCFRDGRRHGCWSLGFLSLRVVPALKMWQSSHFLKSIVDIWHLFTYLKTQPPHSFTPHITSTTKPVSSVSPSFPYFPIAKYEANLGTSERQMSKLPRNKRFKPRLPRPRVCLRTRQMSTTPIPFPSLQLSAGYFSYSEV